MFAVGDDGLVVAVGCGQGPEAGQAIGKEMAALRKVAFGPVTEHF